MPVAGRAGLRQISGARTCDGPGCFRLAAGGTPGWCAVSRREPESPDQTFAVADVLPRFLVGALLLVASGSKAYGLFAQGAADDAAGLPIWLTAALLPAEAILGMWLIIGAWASAARILAVTLFSAFGCHSLLAGLQGRPSCGCFDQLTVNPWIMMAVDACAVGLLLWWRPRASQAATGGERPRCPLKDAESFRAGPVFAHKLRCRVGPGPCNWRACRLGRVPTWQVAKPRT